MIIKMKNVKPAKIIDHRKLVRVLYFYLYYYIRKKGGFFSFQIQ